MPAEKMRQKVQVEYMALLERDWSEVIDEWQVCEAARFYAQGLMPPVSFSQLSVFKRHLPKDRGMIERAFLQMLKRKTTNEGDE